MKRFALEKLLAWKADPKHRPLIVRGARQVGKTWLIEQFAKENYRNYLYLNFDQSAHSGIGRSLFDLFQESLEPERIVKALETLFNTTVSTDDTLLFFDEVQEQPRALQSLKYFNEQAPGYDIIAAGSQMGIAMHAGVSIPVGKVDMMYMYPMTFAEFLCATGQEKLAEALAEQDWRLTNSLHGAIIESLRNYLCIGGMPAVVQDFVERDNLTRTRDLQRDVLDLYRVDFSKHAPANQLARIWQIWDSIPRHLAQENKKFIWGAVRPGARAKDFEIAMQWLFDYGVAGKVERISKPGLPLKAYAEANVFKLYLSDVGLLGALAELPVNSLLTGDAAFTEFKGALTEQYVFQQLVAHAGGGPQGSRPFYWTGRAAEVDFVMQFDGEIIPVEVKAKENLRSQSLKVYYQRYAPSKAIRTSLSPYREQDWLVNVPLYAVEQLPL
ncbi:MAG: ATP-binding protein [Coriobacteriales bacterium]|jgi:predicted AAA+ superfamily ATPase|nr:ATP-binding protein [Coriobacteriales bacterium]